MSDQTIPPSITGARRVSEATPYLTILYHSDVGRIGQRASLRELHAGPRTELNRATPEFTGRGAPSAPLADLGVSKRTIVVGRSGSGGMFIDVPADLPHVRVEGADAHGRVDVRADDLVRGVVIELGKAAALLLHLHDGSSPDDEADLGMIGQSAAIAQVRAAVRRLGPEPDTVLIRGETGTGKDRVAEALWRCSGDRSRKPYVPTNMGVFGETSLAAAHLFGWVRGSHATAYADAPGVFGAAAGGTAFLDEIGETAPSVQAVLLRALQTGRVSRFGEAADRPLDVRLLCATDADLERAMLEGRIRRPFFERIATHQIYVPPLRERREDIALLLFHFLREDLGVRGYGGRLSPAADPRWINARIVSALVRTPWPGNVRALRGLAKHLAVEHGPLERIDTQHPRLLELIKSTPSHNGAPVEWSDTEWLRELARHQFSVTRLAQATGSHETTVRDRIARCEGFVPITRRPREEITQVCEEEGWRTAAVCARLMAPPRALRARLTALGIDASRLVGDAHAHRAQPA